MDSVVGLSTDPVSGAFLGAASDLGLPTYGFPLNFVRLYSSAALVAQGGTTGVLMSAAKFSAVRTLYNTDVFNLGYTLSLTSS